MRKNCFGYTSNCFGRIPFWATILAIILLIMPVGSAADIEVFSQNYLALGSIPDNVVNTNYQSPYISNIAMSYSGGSVNGQWTATNKDGYIFIGGLTPAVNTTYNLVLDFGLVDNQSTNFNIRSGYMWLVLYKDAAGNLRVYQHYDEDSNPAVHFTVPAASITYPFNLAITFDGANHTYSSTVGSNTLTTPFIGGNDSLAYPVVQGNDMQFSAYTPHDETNARILIYSINQTIPATGSVTAIGDKNLVSFGFDGPQPRGSWENGAAYIDSKGGKGTIWADNRDTYTDIRNAPNITHLLDEGWELGIRFSEPLTSFSDPYAMIDDNTTKIAGKFGQTPTSWCSVQTDSENVTFANYSYYTHGMIWRNGLMGQAELGNIGMLHNGTWPFWANVSKGGITFRSFVQKTDIEPAETWSIDSSKFQTWVDNYADNGMTITPYITWYKTGANTYDSAFTDNPDPAAILNFTAHTNGYPAYVYVALPFASGYKVYNTDGPTEVPYAQALDGNIQFYVDDGSTYYVPGPAPTVTGITPATGLNTSTIDITNLAGTGFFGAPEVNLMKTGELNITATAVTVVDPTNLTCTFDLTGKTAGLWDIVVTNPDGQEGSLPAGFEITEPAPIPAPTVSGISPATGLNTSTIGITNLAGTGFFGAPEVNLMKTGELNITATAVTVVDPTNLTCTFDLTGKTAGLWDVVVTNPDGQEAMLPNGFTITAIPVVAHDIPLVGDFNNDGSMDIGVFRAGQWILDYTMDRTVDRRFQYGLATDKPLVGDFNNDLPMDIGVFRSGQWILDWYMDRTADLRFNYGIATDIPLVGDFNNDGTMDIGVFRAGQWILDYNMDRTVDRRFQYGI